MSNISLPVEQCIKCLVDRDILLSFCTPFGEFCDHKFCQSCFRKENTKIINTANPIFTCPFCCGPFYDNIQSIDEAILIGEAASLSTHIFPYLLLPIDVAIPAESVIKISKTNELVIEKLEAAILSNPANFYSIYLLFLAYRYGHVFLMKQKQENLLDSQKAMIDSCMMICESKLIGHSYKLLDYSSIPEGYEAVRGECFSKLASVFDLYSNTPAALRHAKLAYEHCMLSRDDTNLNSRKEEYLSYRAAFAKLPPLRFAVGDEVEFLHELETGSEWKLGKVVELYYRKRDFNPTFNAPYRVQLLEDSDSVDQPPVYAWVKADLDHYVCKVGVRLIEDTRYQARLDAKVEELSRVYCSKEFIDDIYRTLAQDREFVEMLQSVWQIELSEDTAHIYRFLVMYREPLIRTDTGYHVPTTDEVIAGIRAYFDPVHLSGAAPSAEGEDLYSEAIRAYVMSVFLMKGKPLELYDNSEHEMDVQWHFLRSIRLYIGASNAPDPILGLCDINDLLGDVSGITVPLEISELISTVSTLGNLRFIYSIAQRKYDDFSSSMLSSYLAAWIALYKCLENSETDSACECPWTYFFVKFCRDRGAGVPKLALALYDKMNMQLSREFIRCANPTCELNRLDQSTGWVKFKLCGGCKAVIYCSKECCVTHFPDHKAHCRKMITVEKAASQSSE